MLEVNSFSYLIAVLLLNWSYVGQAQQKYSWRLEVTRHAHYTFSIINCCRSNRNRLGQKWIFDWRNFQRNFFCRIPQWLIVQCCLQCILNFHAFSIMFVSIQKQKKIIKSGFPVSAEPKKIAFFRKWFQEWPPKIVFLADLINISFRFYSYQNCQCKFLPAPGQ